MSSRPTLLSSRRCQHLVLPSPGFLRTLITSPLTAGHRPVYFWAQWSTPVPCDGQRCGTNFVQCSVKPSSPSRGQPTVTGSRGQRLARDAKIPDKSVWWCGGGWVIYPWLLRVRLIVKNKRVVYPCFSLPHTSMKNEGTFKIVRRLFLFLAPYVCHSLIALQRKRRCNIMKSSLLCFWP